VFPETNSLLSTTSPRPVSQSTGLFVLPRAQRSRDPSIARKIVWRSAENVFVSRDADPGAYRPRRGTSALFAHCLSTACVRVYRREASRTINRPRGLALASLRTRCRRRGSAWLCASVPAGACGIRPGRSSHHCGTTDKGALNVLKTPCSGSAHSPNRSLRTTTPFFRLARTSVCQRCVLPRATCAVEYTWFRIRAKKRWDSTFFERVDILKKIEVVKLYMKCFKDKVSSSMLCT